MRKGEYAAQSAMEYLMTYGWAILIILIVLAVLYIIGVFTPSGIVGNQCNVKFHYTCTDLALATNGTVSFLLGQNNGYNEYNVAVACTTGTDSTGGPYPSNAWVYLNASGVPKTSYTPGNAYELDSGTTLQVNNTPCYSNTGAALGNQPIGTAFSGILWVRYTTAPGPEGGQNGWILEQIASPYITVGKSGGATQSTTSTGGSTTTSTTTTSTSTTTVVGTFISGGNSGALPVSAVLSGSFSSYICAAGADASTLPNYIVDVNDSWGPNVSVLGHGTSYCTIADNPALASKYGTLTAALATVGLTNAPAPTIYNKPLWPGESGGVGSINYSITQPNSFVIITAACGYGWGCSGYTFPSGCTQRQSITDSNGDIAVVATCQSQASGKYYAYFSSTTQLVTCSYCKAGVEYPLGSILGASMAAYVYANYTPTGS